MKKIFLKCICLLATAFIFSSGIMAQDTTRLVAPPLFTGNNGYRTWSIGVHGGVMAPFSAFGGRNDFSNWESSPGFGAYIKKQVTHGLAMQVDFLKGKLKANNDKLWGGLPPPGPYRSFETDLHWAASLSGVVTLGNIIWSQMHTHIQPYASLGAGVINFNPKLVTNAGTSVDFRPSGSVTDFFVPLGLGLKVNLSSGVNLDLGYTIGFVDGDNLDGYFKDPILSDKFSYGHIGLEFSLGNKSMPQLARHNAPAQLAQNMRDENDAMRASLAASEARYNQRLSDLNGLRDELNRMKMDSDGDGVSDFFDKCPGTPAGVKVDGAGCALPVPPPPVKDTIVQQTTTTTYVITEEDKQIVNEAIRNLEFDFGKATIRPRSFPYLNRVADLLVKKGFGLKLGGHTDNVGSDAANLKLSKNRAESVKNYLVAQGANSGRIEAVGYGESQPIATNGTAEGRQKNRRVEFTLY